MDENTPTPQKRSRIVTIVLVCSLALNLIFVGGLIGRAIFGGPPGHLPNNMGWMIRHLDDEQRKQLKPTLREHAKSLRPLRHEMRAARQRLNATIQEDPLDDAALDLALEELRSASSKFQIATHGNMSSLLKKMSPAARREALKFLNRRETGRRHFGERHRSKESPSQEKNPQGTESRD